MVGECSQVTGERTLEHPIHGLRWAGAQCWVRLVSLPYFHPRPLLALVGDEGHTLQLVDQHFAQLSVSWTDDTLDPWSGFRIGVSMWVNECASTAKLLTLMIRIPFRMLI